MKQGLVEEYCWAITQAAGCGHAAVDQVSSLSLYFSWSGLFIRISTYLTTCIANWDLHQIFPERYSGLNQG